MEKIDLSEISPSRSDARREIIVPEVYSADLAYFCGLMAGDGNITFRPVKRYTIKCSGNPVDEISFYETIVSPLVEKLFNIKPKCRFVSGGTYGFTLDSKLICLFLVKCLGLPANRKYEKLRIPDWVRAKEEFLVAYLRGLSDTDFSLSLKKRYKDVGYYPVITGCSNSKRYMQDVAAVLEAFGIAVSRSFDVKQEDVRAKAGHTITHRVHIYGHTELMKWMNTIGFSSPKHLAKFELWKERNRESKWEKVQSALNEAKSMQRPLITAPAL